MKEWLRQTHGPNFELLRHFLARFFDSDAIATPGQMAPALIGAFSMMLPWLFVFAGPLLAKYKHFSQLAAAGPYRQIVRADELWLIALTMSAIGLLTAVKWQSCFPSLRDYRALGTLPLRARQIFGAKLATLLLVSTAAIVTLNLLPSLLFPAVSASRWQFSPSLGGRVLAHATACIAACYFFFFGLVALQGALLNLLRPRPFGRVTGFVQGLLVAVMLILIVLSFSIDSQITDKVLRPELARWLPPVWFLGLYQAMLGDPDPAMQALAHRAVTALAMAVGLALASYQVSYRRHRELLVEGLTGPSKDRRWSGAGGWSIRSAIFRWLIPNPRQQAVIVFMAKTLARSSSHRMVLMGYGGFGLAVLMSGIMGVRSAVEPAQVNAASFVYAHVVLLAFLTIGLRHLFSIPMELSANWMFQITEREGRGEWLRAMDRLVLLSGAAAMVVFPFPLEFKLLGWRAVAESVLFSALALLCYEWAFSAWEKLPFTCSHLPGKTPMWIVFLRFLGLLMVLPLVNLILLSALYHWVAFIIVMAVQLAVWGRIHSARRDGWGEQRLKYDEAPDPVIRGLNLLE
jgi:hypothetical protein